MSGTPLRTAVGTLRCIAALSVLGGCASQKGQPQAAASPHLALAGASFAADGTASIKTVPATPYPAEPPPAPGKVESLVERFARENGLTLAQAEARINGDAGFRAETERLGEVLRREQSANFLGFRVVRDPAVAVEVSFSHDAAKTFTRYTKDSRFRPVSASRTPAQMEALSNMWLGRFQQAGVNSTMGRNDLDGRLDIDLGISAEEWRGVARAHGWTWDNEVRFTYAAPAPPALREPGLAAAIRVFPRAASAATIVLTSATYGRVVLDHGCFRLAADRGLGSLVLFDRSATLGRDAEGYLTIFEGAKPASRIGERAIWGGYPGADEGNPDVKALRRACGSGPIASVGVPVSERTFALPYPEWVANYARAKQVTYRQAWTTILACMKRREADGAHGLELREGCYTQFN